MPALIPLIPGENNYQLGVPLGGVTYLITVRWNSRDSAWYMDLAEDNGTMIMAGMKIVLGLNIGSRSAHPFFRLNRFTARDMSGSNIDANYDDLGTRVVLEFGTFPDDLSSLVIL